MTKDLDTDFRLLHLPPQQVFGDELEYDKVVYDHFQRLFPPAEVISPTHYSTVHIAAGSDTYYANPRDSIGAVAHMYVVFARTFDGNIEYCHAMREALARLAMTFSLERLQESLRELRIISDREHRNHAMLLEQVRTLDDAIKQTEHAARGVRLLTLSTAFQKLSEWVDFLRLLVSVDHPVQEVCGVRIVGEHSSWTEEHYASAILFLTSIRDSQLFAAVGLAGAWEFYRQHIYPREKEDNPFCRCLKRLGFLEESALQRLRDETYVEILKDGLCDHDPTKRQTLLMLSYMIGAKVGAGSAPATEAFALHQAINLELVFDGLHRLFECLLKDEKHNSKSILVEPNVSLLFALDEDQVKIRLSPITVAGTVTPRIDEDGWRRVTEKVRSLLDESLPPKPDSDDTSQAALLTVGITPGNWSDRNTLTLGDAGSGFSVRRTLNDGGIVAGIHFERNDGLWVEYARDGVRIE